MYIVETTFYLHVFINEIFGALSIEQCALTWALLDIN